MISNLDFEDESVFECFRDFLSESNPFNGFVSNSKVRLESRARGLFVDLKEDCSNSYCMKDKNNELAFILFGTVDESEKTLMIDFCCPSLKSKLSIIENFYCILCILDYALDSLNLDKVFASLERGHNANKYFNYLERASLNRIKVKHVRGKRYPEFTVTKNDVKEVYEIYKTKIKKGRF